MSFIHTTGTALLRHLPAEPAHTVTVRLLKAGLGPKAMMDDPALRTDVGGLSLPNPIGLAAGFDKNAEVPDAMLAAGFGFVECGTVTPRPQLGNPKPRLFRLPAHKAVINRMGFNNDGLDRFAQRLEQRQDSPGILGANLGANKDSADRIDDYVTGLKRLWGLCDYFTINISSPNTPGLRNLQGEGEMDDLLGRLAETRRSLICGRQTYPLFLKVAPDIEIKAVPRIVEQVRTYAFDGIIVSNTTLDRPDYLGPRWRDEAGGLSGDPVFETSTRLLSHFHEASEGRIDLIGVGGISSGERAYTKIKAGAKALQLYSALVFHGPGLVQDICNDLVARLSADGFTSVLDAVGTD